MTVAIDTNLLVRFLTGDDPEQAKIATDSIRQGFLLSATVAMETEWVLRSAYGWPRDRIVRALERFAKGADLADMLHLSMASEADAFLTFDRRIEPSTGHAPPVRIITLA